MRLLRFLDFILEDVSDVLLPIRVSSELIWITDAVWVVKDKDYISYDNFNTQRK